MICYGYGFEVLFTGKLTDCAYGIRPMSACDCVNMKISDDFNQMNISPFLILLAVKQSKWKEVYLRVRMVMSVPPCYALQWHWWELQLLSYPFLKDLTFTFLSSFVHNLKTNINTAAPATKIILRTWAPLRFPSMRLSALRKLTKKRITP